MKTIILSLACAATLPAQVLAPAFKIEEGTATRIWIEDANTKTIRYRESPKSLNKKDSALRDITVKLVTPPEYSAALALFHNRNYEAAQPAFKAAAEKYSFTERILGNFSTLAGFYQIECARNLGNYEEIEQLFRNFKPEPLARKTHHTQLKINPIYNAIRTEDWPRLLVLCEEWADKKVPGSIRAQLEYAHGLALEGQGELEEALIAYNKALVADYAASEGLTRKAALACFGIYHKHPEVEQARKLHDSPEENPNSTGAQLLSEAAALVQMWKSSLGRDQELPDDYQAFAKYSKL